MKQLSQNSLNLPAASLFSLLMTEYVIYTMFGQSWTWVWVGSIFAWVIVAAVLWVRRGRQ